MDRDAECISNYKESSISNWQFLIFGKVQVSLRNKNLERLNFLPSLLLHFLDRLIELKPITLNGLSIESSTKINERNVTYTKIINFLWFCCLSSYLTLFDFIHSIFIIKLWQLLVRKIIFLIFCGWLIRQFEWNYPTNVWKCNFYNFKELGKNFDLSFWF